MQLCPHSKTKTVPCLKKSLMMLAPESPSTDTFFAVTHLVAKVCFEFVVIGECLLLGLLKTLFNH